MLKQIKKIHGPYIRKDGRRVINIHYADGTIGYHQYARWLMMVHLDRELDPDKETIDHINGDKLDDRLENLRIIDRSTHAKEDAVRAELVEIECIWCHKKVLKRGNDLRHNAKQGKAGPFCGKSCAGAYGAEIQNGRCDAMGRTYLNVVPIYYKPPKT